ncbi:hypothetical protein LCGC14_0509290 [marine sediment metagenome]|uniref:DNA primase/polymerase bifunctional N-terminal domain-containing protein n=1 Tax=marine sediment metagenome TaxID=412755 RepID=A0A0F9V9Z4_9ZZZZ|nr:hypothetical protein [bacterium]
MDKKAWLDELYYKLGKQQYDFRVCGLKKQSDGEVISTRWRKYSEVCFPLEPWESKRIDWINNREVLPCEIVIDLEEKEGIGEIVERLRGWGVKFYIFETGSRGYHIHIFFKRTLNSHEKLKIIRTLGADEQKAHDGSLIALENTPHWKTGKIKEEIKWIYPINQ